MLLVFGLKILSPEQDFSRKENQGSRIILERPRLQISRRNYQPKLLAVKKQRNFIAVDERVIKINGEKRYLWAAIDVSFCLLSGIILLDVIFGLMLPLVI